MLTNTQCTHFLEHGWVAVEDVFEPDEVSRIAELATDVSFAELYSLDAPTYTVDLGPDRRMAPRKIEMPSRKHAAFRAFVFDRRLVALVQSILGRPPILIRDQLFMKPPRFGSEKPFHQDLAHFQCEPADKIVAAWVALDDAYPDNGCLRYIDGSHRGALLPHAPVPGAPYDLQPRAEAVDRSRERAASVRRGGVVLHHSKVLHMTGRNETADWRRAYSCHWVTDEVVCSDRTFDIMYVPACSEETQL